MLYVAWLESGMRCPVIGCEPWAALDADQQELRELHLTGTYSVLSGGQLPLKYQAAKSEFLWLSEGSLDTRPPLRKMHMKATWESLRELMGD
jgi:hypothetical protein